MRDNIDDLLLSIKEELLEVAKKTTFESYWDTIEIDVEYDINKIIVNITIDDWNIYIQLPLSIIDDDILYNDYLQAIKYAISNHSRNLDLEFYVDANEYQVESTPDSIKLDI